MDRARRISRGLLAAAIGIGAAGASFPAVAVADAGAESTRPFGGRTRLLPPAGSPEGNGVALLEAKYFPPTLRRPERSFFRARVRRLDPSTDYTLWADDPATPAAELVQFAAVTTGRTGSFRYARDTAKGESLPFGMMLGDLAERPVEVRDAAGTTTILDGGVTSSVGSAPSILALTAVASSSALLASARTYAVLAGSTVTNTGATALTGDLGLYPGTSITGFPPGTVSGTVHTTDAAAMTAQADAQAAYATLAARTPDADLSGQDLGTLTLEPGTYLFATTAQLTGGLVLDAKCDSSAVFVFQIGTTLITAAGSSVVVINGGLDYDESNIHWQVGTSATLGAGTALLGNVLADQSISFAAGATMLGSALALHGAVTLSTNTVESPPVPVDTSTLVLTPYWGHGTDSRTAALDKTKILVTYAYVGGSDGAMDPAADGMTIVLGPLGETTPLTLDIPAAAAEWTQGGDTWYWQKIVAGVDWRVSVDDTTHSIMVYAGGFDFSPGNGEGLNVWGGSNGLDPNNETFPWYLSIVSGDDNAVDISCFRNSLTFNHAIQWGVLRIP